MAKSVIERVIPIEVKWNVGNGTIINQNTIYRMKINDSEMMVGLYTCIINGNWKSFLTTHFEMNVINVTI